MRRAHAASDGGFTLVEVIVVLGMFALIAAVVTVTVAHTAQISATANTRAVDTFSASQAAFHITEQVAAGAVVAAGTDVLVVEVDQPGRCVRSTFTIIRDASTAPQQVTESVHTVATGEKGRCADITPDAWVGRTADVTRTLISDLRAPVGGEPVWALYSRGNAVLDATSSDPAVAAVPCAIARVDVTLAAGAGEESTAVPARASAAVGARTWGVAC